MKILFFGTDSHSAQILQFLIDNNYEIVGCISQPDKIQGRKKQLIPTKVKEIAINNNIKIFQPEKLKEDYDFIFDLDYDVALTVAYGQIIPASILNQDNKLNINVHYSLLPKYRGSSPVQTALLNGNTVTGISLMEMIPELDAGDVFVQEKIDIDKDDTATTLFEKLNAKACLVLDQYLEKIWNKEIIGIKQNSEEATFTKKINKELELIDFTKDGDEIYNNIRALLDNPGCYFIKNNKRYKIIKAREVSGNYQKNTIIDIKKDYILIGCSKNAIKILEIQPEGKKPMPISAFLNGKHDFEIGDQL